LSVVCDETVEAGDELNIAYCDVQQPLAARRRQLSRHYRFVCACERCRSEASGASSKPRLNFGNGGGAPREALSKREKRERREQRAATKADGCDASLGPVRVAVDLRVLLKLTKPAALPGSDLSARMSKQKRKPQRQPSQQLPVCCVTLRLVALAGSADAQQAPIEIS